MNFVWLLLFGRDSERVTGKEKGDSKQETAQAGTELGPLQYVVHAQLFSSIPDLQKYLTTIKMREPLDTATDSTLC